MNKIKVEVFEELTKSKKVVVEESYEYGLGETLRITQVYLKRFMRKNKLIAMRYGDTCYSVSLRGE